jgi:hypothetical protein
MKDRDVESDEDTAIMTRCHRFPKQQPAVVNLTQYGQTSTTLGA